MGGIRRESSTYQLPDFLLLFEDAFYMFWYQLIEHFKNSNSFFGGFCFVFFLTRVDGLSSLFSLAAHCSFRFASPRFSSLNQQGFGGAEAWDWEFRPDALAAGGSISLVSRHTEYWLGWQPTGRKRNCTVSVARSAAQLQARHHTVNNYSSQTK